MKLCLDRPSRCFFQFFVFGGHSQEVIKKHITFLLGGRGLENSPNLEPSPPPKPKPSAARATAAR